MAEFLNTIDNALNTIENINDPTLSISFVCMLFDHVCETYGLDKEDTLEKICFLIREVNSSLGNMYEA